MPPEHQIRIDELKRFYEDFRRFHRLLLDQRSAESTARSGQNRTPPEELEELRQTLLRTRGAVEPLFERVIGRLLQPTPHGQVDAWELALYKQYPYNQAFFAGVLADSISTLIGSVEHDPSLLEPPKPTTRMVSPQVPTTLVNVHGGVVNIGQTGSGNVAQTAIQIPDVRDLQEQLGELEQAIRDLDAPEEERESFSAPVQQLRAELTQPKPLTGRLVAAWGAVRTFATVQSAWQGWDRVQAIATDLAPKIEALISAATQPAP